MSLESFRIQPLRLDHIDAHIPDRLIAHELDSAGRILRVQLTDGGDVRDTTGTSLSLAWRHQRGASGLEPFSVVDAATGVYEVTYPNAMMLDGVATCSIQVTEGSSIAATRNFHVRIQDAPIDGDATASTETWTALQLVLTQGQTAVTALEEQHTEHATAHDAQMQQQASEFSTAQSARAGEFTDALTDYQAQIDAAAASATEVYIGTGTPHENAVLWIDTTGGGKRVKSLVDGQWVEPTAEVMRPLDADTLGGIAPSGYQTAITDSGWVRITPADSTYYTSNAYVRRIGGVVHVRGSLARSDQANLELGWTPGIIPAGYRPMTNTVVMCAGANVTGSNAFFKVSITASDGMITIRANPSANNSLAVYLDGLCWMTN